MTDEEYGFNDEEMELRKKVEKTLYHQGIDPADVDPTDIADLGEQIQAACSP